ncbi:helix-turn-helix transcriptional regulator [Thiomicrorhabdus indica]|uniref:helix-turn-helix transcriptional regulator n=1 Tax=Thiomicrorhabdus indica TaxID=2267253 RepID=UPI001981DDC7|nr:LuxR C-terminal-related transcriptional regulator [Thiomicrorhabdus indica]
MKKLNVLKFSLSVFITIFIISAVDISHDFKDFGHMNAHIWVEMFMGLLSFIAFSVILLSIRQQGKNLETANEDLTQVQQELKKSHDKIQKLAEEFSLMVLAQFEEWQLTNTEKEIGLLLLKGLSTVEISEIRDTREKTVRQQASNLYRKAKLAGRHELSAYFFEDLLLSSTFTEPKQINQAAL